jgi:hypothetical protein
LKPFNIIYRHCHSRYFYDISDIFRGPPNCLCCSPSYFFIYIILVRGKKPCCDFIELLICIGLELYTQLKRKDSGINIFFLTASSEPYREELLKEKYNQLSKDLFLEMPLPTSEIIREVKKRMQIPQ